MSDTVEHNYLSRLSGLSVKRIEEKANSGFLNAYAHGQIWETGRKRVAYRQFLLKRMLNPADLSVDEMERLLPQKVTDAVAKNLKKQRLELIQSGVLKQLSEAAAKKIKQYAKQAPRGLFAVPAFEYALRRYARLKTHYRVPVEARDAAARYLCYKLQERAFVVDLDERLSARLDETVSALPAVEVSRPTVIGRLKNLFCRQRD